MNLFNSPTISELSTLISKCDDCTDFFHIMVDHDGEVLIAANSSKTRRILPKYKFHICGLKGKAFIGSVAANNLIYLNQLYKDLLYCWEKDLTGKIDFDKISRVQNLNYWLEINRFPQTTIENDIITIFFKNNIGLHVRPSV